MSGPHGGGQRPSPLARCIQVDTPIPVVGELSPTAAIGPWDVHLRGQFHDRGTQQPATCPFPRSVLLVASTSHFPPPTSPIPLCPVVCVLYVHPPAWHAHHPGLWCGYWCSSRMRVLPLASAGPHIPACAGGEIHDRTGGGGGVLEEEWREGAKEKGWREERRHERGREGGKDRGSRLSPAQRMIALAPYSRGPKRPSQLCLQPRSAPIEGALMTDEAPPS